MTQPAGHPEPEPIPTPDPEPPLPIPPPDPIPVPEPPHADPPASQWAAPAGEPAPAVSLGPQPSGAGEKAQPSAAGESQRDTQTLPLGPHAVDAELTTPTLPVTRATGSDFIDGDPPTAPAEWPPLGAYPGEPGHPAAQIGQEPTQIVHPVHEETTAQPAHWQQPWHAQHERQGEWQTQHSPPPEFQEQPTQPVWGAPPAPPWQVQLNPQQPAGRRAGLWVSMALTLILLLCGGGAVSAYFLITNADTGQGAPDPATAVNRFLTAVYTQQDATAADDLVCRDARDPDQLSARVAQVKDLANQYEGPTFRWSEPAVNGQTDERATVTVQLTLSTDDEKTAQQTLTFTTVHKTGWLVCDIRG